MRFVVVIILVLISVPLTLFGNKQDTLKIDLSKYEVGSKNTVKENVKYKAILLENALIDKLYSYDYYKKDTFVESLDFEIATSKYKNSVNITMLDSLKKPCKLLDDKIDSLSNINNEIQMGKIVDEIKDDLYNKVCKEDSSAILTAIEIKAKKEISKTKYPIEREITVNSGEEITLVIKRGTSEWTFVFQGQDKGKFITTYGFVFTPDPLNGSSFYSQQTDSSIYRITKLRKPDRLDLKYTPAVFFSYLPSRQYKKHVYFMGTAGIGFDLNAPVLFFGGNCLVSGNIGIGLGLAFQQQERLKRKFKENQNINFDLDGEDLHDMIYRPNLFVSVNFRFKNSPFSNASESTNN